jgi:c(7)-type cytochrome triheme protein
LRPGKRLILVILLALAVCGTASGGKFPAPRLYGRVIIRNYSAGAGLAPVVFDHWVHRARYTCRLCHVDVGFAMQAGASGIDAATNAQGYYCGACHDGERTYGFMPIFKACSEDPSEGEPERCVRCHSKGKSVKKEHDYEAFAEKMPLLSPGNFIDWEAAEAKGLIRPVDFLEGISIKRDPLEAQEDFSIVSKVDWMTDVIFSHKKHAVWNGCELCHPEIFASTKKGTAKYTMFHIARGEYCGVCHTKVAFNYMLCNKCHEEPVR